MMMMEVDTGPVAIAVVGAKVRPAGERKNNDNKHKT